MDSFHIINNKSMKSGSAGSRLHNFLSIDVNFPYTSRAYQAFCKAIRS